MISKHIIRSVHLSRSVKSNSIILWFIVIIRWLFTTFLLQYYWYILTMHTRLVILRNCTNHTTYVSFRIEWHGLIIIWFYIFSLKNNWLWCLCRNRDLFFIGIFFYLRLILHNFIVHFLSKKRFLWNNWKTGFILVMK